MRSATFDDIPAVVAVAAACDLADIGEIDPDGRLASIYRIEGTG